MRKSKFTEGPIVTILREADAGVAVPDLLRKYKINGLTFTCGRRSTAEWGVAELQRLMALERGNARLKGMYADQTPGLTTIKDVLTRKL
jgi:putative transposase